MSQSTPAYDLNGRRIITTNKRVIAENLFQLGGKPFSLNHHPPFREIYESTHNHIVICSGRQVGKSTTAANFQVAECIGQPYWGSIGVLPSVMQMRRYSNQRVGEVIANAPLIKKWFQNAASRKNTMERSFANGSIMYFGALSQIESLRGLSANRILEDEVQDMVSDDLPIVEESLSGQPSHMQYIMRTGTAKTVGNLLETTLRESTMNEWIVICPSGHHNIPAVENIERDGFTCKKCKSLCDVRNGYWLATNGLYTPEGEVRKWLGFRVPQIIMPGHTEDTKKWHEIYHKRHRLDPMTFMNEVMGAAAGSGIDFLSEDDLRKCTEPNYQNALNWIDDGGDYYVKMATVDWGLTAKKSFTVLSIWGVTKTGRIKLIHVHRYMDPDIFRQVDDIAKRIIAFGASQVGVDWGAGFAQSRILEEKIKRPVHRFMYVSEMAELMRYDKEAQLYKVNRTQAMTETFLKMRKQLFHFPEWRQFEEFAKDILCIFVEPLDDKRSMNDKFKYDHPADSPDDFAHTCVYANLLYHMITSR